MSDTPQPDLTRILSLDVGLRRIGLALSDPLRITAQGLDTVVRKNLRTDLWRLHQIAKQHEVGMFLVGYPLHMSGDAGRQAQLVADFASKLEQRTSIPVTLWDERLTTVQAGRVLRSSGIGIEKRAKAIDKLSAVLILQSYLDSLPEACPWPEEE
ncbi:MAG: Holliday junction resolvase RuvX [Acidobacteria bacterium]|nr:Holliday junction resolvase RuvX [Acidobacteriota bacterium]